MFARFNENPEMTLQDIKETKHYGRTDGQTHGHTDARTDGQRENSIPPTNKVCGGYNKGVPKHITHMSVASYHRLSSCVPNQSLDKVLLPNDTICKWSNLNIHEYL